MLAVGDEGFQRKCLARMNTFHYQGKTVVFVSHDMNAVRSQCDRVLLLDRGLILAEGEPERIIACSHDLLKPSQPLPAARST